MTKMVRLRRYGPRRASGPALSRGRRLALLLVFAVLPAAPGQAALVDEIRVGLLYHDPGGWGGSAIEEGFDLNGELIFSPALDLLSGVLRPNLGFSLNSEGDTSKIYGGAVWEYRWPRGLFFYLALGLAAHNVETDDGSVARMNQLASPGRVVSGQG